MRHTDVPVVGIVHRLTADTSTQDIGLSPDDSSRSGSVTTAMIIQPIGPPTHYSVSPLAMHLPRTPLTTSVNH